MHLIFTNGSPCAVRLTILAAALLMLADAAAAQNQHTHDAAATQHDALHFSHPLITESPSPDTKVRFDYDFEEFEDEAGRSNTLTLETEYAFSRSFSLEVAVPYVFLNPDLSPAASNVGDVEIGLKFATFAFEEHGLLLGGGIEFSIPTGSEDKHIGGEHLEIEPFVNAGYQRGRFEAVTFVHVEIPTNQEKGEPFESEFAYNVSLLYHVKPWFQLLLEHDGETALTGEKDEVVGHLTPGFKLRPIAAAPSLLLGLGYSIPVTTHKEFESHTRVSLFYHF